MVGPVFSATTTNDKVMYVFLTATIFLGMSNTVVGNIISHYDYREELAVWFRQIFYFQPHPELMVDAPFTFKAHAIVAFLLFAIWPFTRLVHVFSAPVGYLWRPYVVYRSRPAGQFGNRPYRRGWIREDVGDVSREIGHDRSRHKAGRGARG